MLIYTVNVWHSSEVRCTAFRYICFHFFHNSCLPRNSSKQHFGAELRLDQGWVVALYLSSLRDGLIHLGKLPFSNTEFMLLSHGSLRSYQALHSFSLMHYIVHCRMKTEPELPSQLLFVSISLNYSFISFLFCCEGCCKVRCGSQMRISCPYQYTSRFSDGSHCGNYILKEKICLHDKADKILLLDRGEEQVEQCR